MYNKFQLQAKMHMTNIDKSLSQGQNSFYQNGAKTAMMGVTSRKKFQNVQRLGNIVKQIEQNNNMSANIVNGNGNNNRQVHPQQVLQIIKAKIKNNYNTLYENYETNKNIILKSIQHTQSSNRNQNNVKNKIQNVIKQKSKCDKLKSQIQNKQRKLKKLLDIRQQVRVTSSNTDVLKQTLFNRLELFNQLENHRNILEYQMSILQNMKQQRSSIKINLKEHYDIVLKQNTMKQQKIKRIQDSTHTKKIILNHLQQKIKALDQCQIPESLAQELQKKLQEYQGKYIQENIVMHQKRLYQQRLQHEREQQQKQYDQIQKQKQKKQKQQQIQFQITYNHFLIKQTQEQQIKRLCRVDNINQIANGSLEEEKNNLQNIKAEIQMEIARLEEQNAKIRSDIESVMVCFQGNLDQPQGNQNTCTNTCSNSNFNTLNSPKCSDNKKEYNSENQQQNNQNQRQNQHISNKKRQQSNGSNFLNLQKQLQEQQAQLRRLKAHADKKQAILIEWQSVLQLIGAFNGKIQQSNMVEKLKSSVKKYERYCTNQKNQNGCPGASARNTNGATTVGQTKQLKVINRNNEANPKNLTKKTSKIQTNTNKSGNSPTNQKWVQQGAMNGNNNRSQPVFIRQHYKNQSSSVASEEVNLQF